MKNNNTQRAELHISRLAYFIAAQLVLPTGMATNALARDYFNPDLLELGTPAQRAVDLSTFEDRDGQIPGTYRVDVFLNDDKKDTRDVEFRMLPDASGKNSLQPCLTAEELASWGVLTQKIGLQTLPGSNCANLAAVTQASANFQFDQLKLLLSFPQSAISNSARGWVDPQKWDDGIAALQLNYSVSGANNYARGGQGTDSSSQFANLRPGVNLGPWRLRNYITGSRSNTEGQDSMTWNSVYTYAQRDIKTLRSRLTMGDSSSPADVFDSVSFRGVQLASDDDMLPESLRGYAPVVRGIARSNAQVTIRQNGYVIYQTYVSPGSFEITDMYPTGGSGDLQVTIKESDGSEQQLVVPFASLPILQREGQIKYAVTAGVYRSYDSSIEKTPLTQGTMIYGLPAGFTVYGGSQLASHYQSLAMGVGKNFGDFGALSLDLTQAWSQQQDEKPESGQSLRVRYSKNLVSTGTNFAIAGYRYATDGYWGMQEVLETYRDGHNAPWQDRRRNRTELTMSQALWEGAGSLSVSGVREDYWNTNRRIESVGLSYSNSFKGVSYSLGYTYNRNSAQGNSGSGRIYDTDQLVSLNLSVPLNTLFGQQSWVGYNMSSSKQGNTNHNVSVGGTALADDSLSWSALQGYGTRGQGNSGGVNADWRATYGALNGGYGYDQHSQRLNYGVQGGIIAHANGVTFSQSLGETVALVEAPGVSGVGIQGQTGVKTDFRGYTVVPYLTPYRKNEVTIDPETLADNAAVDQASQTVIPTRGAVVRATYQTSVGRRVLMELKRNDGRVVPFGATVSPVADNSQEKSFIVGDNGQVYLTGLADSGVLNVKWGNGRESQCQVKYRLPADKNSITNVDGLCQ